ncbi:NlpC/P60 family protein [Streptomyces sp. NPDC050560]|uniref:C40 family peptidase n=1 Tax=Streptomyces sp. NPDC050560 TaxID=3365630 RepID=UPI0037A0236D
MARALVPRVRTALATAAVLTGTLAVPAQQAAAAPGPGPARAASAAGLLTELRGAYRQAGQATETYNATAEKLRDRRAESERLQRRLKAARAAAHRGRQAAGRLAREQYQGSSSGLSPYLRLLLSRDPQRAADQGHVIQRLSADRAAAVRRLTGGERTAGRLAAEADRALTAQEKLAKRQRTDRDRMRKRLAGVEKRLAGLDEGQLAALRRLEDGSPTDTRAAGAAGAPAAADGGAPSAGAGAAAVAYALRQLGKPYVWGATGPDSYDCSGLTSRAWAHAGVTIPRTSQQQWARLPKVPVDRVRPGDLVIYFPGATHVGMYVGDGRVVHAPHPGAVVTVSPMRANPVRGVVRPG